MQTELFTRGKDAVHCGEGCSALQERLQCTATAIAVHCGKKRILLYETASFP